VSNPSVSKFRREGVTLRGQKLSVYTRREALDKHGVVCAIVETKVDDQDLAVSMGFLGSLTVRINGLRPQQHRWNQERPGQERGGYENSNRFVPDISGG
jgi:hypothetical protein